MPHGIEIRNGEASMMYVGEAPWHGLGTALDGPATAAEAIRAARLDWSVVKKPLYAVNGDRLLRVPDRFAIVREDLAAKPDCPVFGIVGKAYTPLQNREAFAFFDSIVGEGAAIYHTAGALGNGERIWILARLPSMLRIVGDDVAEKFLLLSNCHDGSGSVQIKFTPVRVVCQNTLTMALQDGLQGIRVLHTRYVLGNLWRAHGGLEAVEAGFRELADTYAAMTRVQMNEKRLDHYLGGVFPLTMGPGNRSAEFRKFKRAVRGQTWSKHFFEQGRGNDLPGVRGTLWAAYNGVTEYVDHDFPPGTSPGGRLSSVWFGKGERIKSRAYRVAADRMGVWRN